MRSRKMTSIISVKYMLRLPMCYEGKGPDYLQHNQSWAGTLSEVGLRTAQSRQGAPVNNALGIVSEAP